MKRIHLFELEDQRWLPATIRDADTDFLRFILEVGNVYAPIIDRLRRALARTNSDEILDLCSGGGGPLVAIRNSLAQAGSQVRVTLSDRYPNHTAFHYASKRGDGIGFCHEAVDATAVPADLTGFRTLFTSLHHFRSEAARRILLDAAEHGRPIAIFDFSARSRPPLAVMLLGNPLGVMLCTGFVRPFRWSRLFWTYVVPVVPFFLMWDAFVSGLRLYSVEELEAIVSGLPPNSHVWEIGRESSFRSTISYVIGYPREASQ